jgi:hypothetical protein
MIKSFWINLFSLFTQIGTIAILILTILEKDPISYIIIILNMISYFSLVYILNKEKYKKPYSYAADNSPPGNAIVTDNNGNNIWTVLGSEKEIQELLQLELSIEETNEYISIFISVFICLISVTTILLTPIMSEKGKIYYSINLLLGLLSGLVYSSKDFNLILEKMAEADYDLLSSYNFKIVTFTNRTAAIAYCFLNTKGNSDQLGKLIPKVNEWLNFRNMLNNINRLDDTEIKLLIEKSRKFKKTGNMLDILINKFDDANKLKDSMLGNKLLKDIIEAFAEMDL